MNPWVKQFLPFAALVGVVVVTLRGFTWIRYDDYRRKVKTYSRDEIKALGFGSGKSSTTLEEEYEKIMENIDLGDWNQPRVPRPWTEDPDRE
ncbi:unnamed protein product [Didymodactylos carnosus]|uniref:Cytochrome c oxidase assembly protein COX16 homolog, mitochondrial n=1 Tax=Didymodactylos carnosus TaxID=1234261 RepID=A0A813P646_9BILA|nr:unnamed protein product [Didymodactylos carnosus]CAF0930393.1 unnamed protein product [Didymodactylos carnosus]CAF3527251.1 unnamed protein product [Didymodactylos carnosus]CAF3707073.1 unnamed protein product [Didymodactylos carnosus]